MPRRPAGAAVRYSNLQPGWAGDRRRGCGSGACSIPRHRPRAGTRPAPTPRWLLTEPASCAQPRAGEPGRDRL